MRLTSARLNLNLNTFQYFNRKNITHIVLKTNPYFIEKIDLSNYQFIYIVSHFPETPIFLIFRFLPVYPVYIYIIVIK